MCPIRCERQVCSRCGINGHRRLVDVEDWREQCEFRLEGETAIARSSAGCFIKIETETGARARIGLLACTLERRQRRWMRAIQEVESTDLEIPDKRAKLPIVLFFLSESVPRIFARAPSDLPDVLRLDRDHIVADLRDNGLDRRHVVSESIKAERLETSRARIEPENRGRVLEAIIRVRIDSRLHVARADEH